MKTLICKLILVLGFCGLSGALFATDLPAEVQAVGTQIGATINPDAGFIYQGQQYTTLVPPGYSATTPISGSAVAQPDGSIVWDSLQFVPIVETPGEMPHFPDNFVPAAGNQLPPDFAPPAGFMPPPTLTLPTGVTVPPLSNAVMVQQMEAAGILPVGTVVFSADGTVSVNGGSSYLPFLPPTAQRGIAQGTSRGLTIGADGVVTFPDGATFAPLVAGTIAGGTTLPPNFTPPAGTTLPATAGLPLQFEIPPTVQIPAGMTLPAGVVIPNNYTIPTGTVLPPGVSIPTGVMLPAGVTVPNGIALPAGTTFTMGSAPVGMTVLPNGSIIVPGTSIPAGMSPPVNWTPPTGVTANAAGGWTLPPPPAGGFPPPIMPTMINTDGSVVMPAGVFSATAVLPPGAVMNADGTVNMPPPPLVGSIGAGGAIQSAGFGYTAPTGFVPLLPPGATMTATGYTLPAGYVPPQGAMGYASAANVACTAPMVPNGMGGCIAPVVGSTATTGTATGCVPTFANNYCAVAATGGAGGCVPTAANNYCSAATGACVGTALNNWCAVTGATASASATGVCVGTAANNWCAAIPADAGGYTGCVATAANNWCSLAPPPAGQTGCTAPTLANNFCGTGNGTLITTCTPTAENNWCGHAAGGTCDAACIAANTALAAQYATVTASVQSACLPPMIPTATGCIAPVGCPAGMVQNGVGGCIAPVGTADGAACVAPNVTVNGICVPPPPTDGPIGGACVPTVANNYCGGYVAPTSGTGGTTGGTGSVITISQCQPGEVLNSTSTACVAGPTTSGTTTYDACITAGGTAISCSGGTTPPAGGTGTCDAVCLAAQVAACPSPSTIVNGVCTAPVAPACASPSTIVNGVCTAPPSPTCTATQHLEGTTCVENTVTPPACSPPGSGTPAGCVG